MTTSGTYAFGPSISQIIDEAFERCGLDLTKIEYRHQRSARNSLNLLFSEWANRGVNLWAVDTQTLTLVAGTATYTLPVGTVDILEAVLRNSSSIDVTLGRLARDEYMALPNKLAAGTPVQFYVNRLASPTITIYLVPNDITTYPSVFYTRMRQMQDVTTAQQTPDIPYRWQEAIAAGLAFRLSTKFAPDRKKDLQLDYGIAFEFATTEDVEHTPTRLIPDLSFYYR